MNKIIFVILAGIIILFLINVKENFSNKLPTGSWKNNCSILDFRYPFLWASCENDRGKSLDTSINISKCIGDRIRNVDGNLECD